MRKILMSGSAKHLVELMKNDGFELSYIHTNKKSDEQTWAFTTYYDIYEYETRVTFQVHEVDENNVPTAINVVKVECDMN